MATFYPTITRVDKFWETLVRVPINQVGRDRVSKAKRSKVGNRKDDEIDALKRRIQCLEEALSNQAAASSRNDREPSNDQDPTNDREPSNDQTDHDQAHHDQDPQGLACAGDTDFQLASNEYASNLYQLLRWRNFIFSYQWFWKITGY